MKKRGICGVCVIKCVEMYETNHARISCHAPAIENFAPNTRNNLSHPRQNTGINAAPCKGPLSGIVLKGPYI